MLWSLPSSKERNGIILKYDCLNCINFIIKMCHMNAIYFIQLTEDGKINHEKALKYVEAHMKDKETQKMLVDAADKCIKEHGKN